MRIFSHRRLRPPRRLSLLLFITSAALFAAPTTALWPFPPKRFSGNSLIGTGSLGLDDGDGSVIAFGDFNGDHLYVPTPRHVQKIVADLWLVWMS